MQEKRIKMYELLLSILFIIVSVMGLLMLARPKYFVTDEDEKDSTMLRERLFGAVFTVVGVAMLFMR